MRASDDENVSIAEIFGGYDLPMHITTNTCGDDNGETALVHKRSQEKANCYSAATRARLELS
jgi:hypothetical protein